MAKKKALVEAGPEDETIDLLNPDDWPHVRYGAWRNARDGRYLVPRYLGGSDYSGSLVERANFRSWSKLYKAGKGKWWTDAPGGHGTFAVVIDMKKVPEDISEDVAETLAALNDYPLIDEEEHSEMEQEAQTEAWDSWAKREWKKGLEELLGNIDLDEADEDKLFETFQKASEKANEYWRNESGGDMYIDIGRIIKELTLADVEAIAKYLDTVKNKNQRSFVMSKKSYEVIAINKKSGKITHMTSGHLTRKEAMTIKSKITPHPLSTLKIRETKIAR